MTAFRRRNHFLGRVLHPVRNDEIQSGVAKDLLRLFDIRAFQTNDNRHLHADRLCRFNDTEATTSQRMIPPKILMSTALTFLSDRRIRNAFFTCSADAPPPTSRKFAGLPPESLMMSIVAIARPAPFTMHATVPSSLI